MDIDPPPLQARLDAAFASLVQPSSANAPSWHPREHRPAEPGRPADSSDEEEAPPRLPGQAELDRGFDEGDAQFLPSRAFQRAMDDEPEFSGHDAMADPWHAGGGWAGGEPKPPLWAEAWAGEEDEGRGRAAGAAGDRRGDGRREAAGNGEAEASEVECRGRREEVGTDVEGARLGGVARPTRDSRAGRGELVTRLSGAADDGGARDASEDPQAKRRSVRFAPEPSSASTDEAREPERPPSMELASGRRGGRLPARPPGPPSTVPDYVRHPDRYTRYDLGTEVVVGGGVGQLVGRLASVGEPGSPFPGPATPLREGDEEGDGGERADRPGTVRGANAGGGEQPTPDAPPAAGSVTYRPSGISRPPRAAPRPLPPAPARPGRPGAAPPTPVAAQQDGEGGEDDGARTAAETRVATFRPRRARPRPAASGDTDA